MIFRLVLFGALFCITFSVALAQEAPTGLTPDQIALYPEPNVTQLYAQDAVIYDRVYRKVVNSLQRFDAPGGNLAEDLGVGFNYVTLSSDPAAEWVQVTSDRWMQSSNLSEDVLISTFAGVVLPNETLAYPMAWTLKHVYTSPSPGAPADESKPFLYRYTKVNLYSAVTVDGFVWYQVGVDEWLHQYDVAKLQPIDRPADVTTSKWVSVDLYEQVLIAYEDTTPVFATLISSGLSEWSTNEGLFNVYLRKDRTVMSGAYNEPDFYYLEEVPWTMYFDDDIALHGTYWHDGFGYRHSHGCVNMSITDAKWVFDWSADIRDFNNPDSKDLTVFVYSSGTYE